jgi:hypothetical protein
MVRRFLAGALWLVLALGGAFVMLVGIVGLWWTSPDNDGRSDTEVLGVTLPIRPAIVSGFITLVGVAAFTAAWLLRDRLFNTNQPNRER